MKWPVLLLLALLSIHMPLLAQEMTENVSIEQSIDRIKRLFIKNSGLTVVENTFYNGTPESSTQWKGGAATRTARVHSWIERNLINTQGPSITMESDRSNITGFVNWLTDNSHKENFLRNLERLLLITNNDLRQLLEFWYITEYRKVIADQRSITEVRLIFVNDPYKHNLDSNSNTQRLSGSYDRIQIAFTFSDASENTIFELTSQEKIENFFKQLSQYINSRNLDSNKVVPIGSCKRLFL